MKPFISLVLIFIVASSCRKEHTSVPQLIESPPKQTIPPPPLPTPPQQLKFKNVVILGNSITFSPPNTSIGWNGSWGMAASVIDSDYVHRLTVKFRKLVPDCKVMIRNIGEFEVDYVHYDFDAKLKDLRDSIPDLLILRIGEDVGPDNYDMSVFKPRYEALVNYFLSGNNKLYVLGVGPLWNSYMVESVMQYTPYVSLSHVDDDKLNSSFGLFANYGIQVHPSDRGMKAISDSIWMGVSRLKSAN
jgi:hypothetical protein